MHFDKFSFGTLQIDGSTYEQDLVIDRGEIHNRKKMPSKKFCDEFGHMPRPSKKRSLGNATDL